jgi:hypothetical protein
MDEMDADPIDLRDEVRQRVQLRFARAPVVVRRPIARQFPHRLKRHALRLICDGLFLGPARGRDTRPQRLDFRLWDLDGERPDRPGAR